MIIIVVTCLAAVGVYLQIYLWPNLPQKYKKYKGLLMMLSLLLGGIILKIPWNSAIAVPIYLLLIVSLYLLWRSSKCSGKIKK